MWGSFVFVVVPKDSSSVSSYPWCCRCREDEDGGCSVVVVDVDAVTMDDDDNNDDVATKALGGG
jgi:hypothetical protein